MFSETPPKLLVLEKEWRTIQQEIPEFDLAKVEEYRTNKVGKYVQEDVQSMAQFLRTNQTWVWRGQEAGGQWFGFPLMVFGQFLPACNQCPNTKKILATIPGVQRAAFTLLTPHSAIVTHKDTTPHKVANLPLHNLQSCHLHVFDLDGSRVSKQHEGGQLIVFASNQYFHYASNDSDRVRVILYVEFE